jgi:general stress protein 26
MSASSSDTRHVRELMRKFSTAMLITHGTDGELHARPMVIADVTEDCALWFVTGEASAKVHEIAFDTRANVVCQKDHSAYLSAAGTASLERDRRRIAELWHESFRVWFPEGKDDPNLVLIFFRPYRAEFWDNTGLNKIAYLWDAARAYVSGKPPHVREGEAHGVVALP